MLKQPFLRVSTILLLSNKVVYYFLRTYVLFSCKEIIELEDCKPEANHRGRLLTMQLPGKTNASWISDVFIEPGLTSQPASPFNSSVSGGLPRPSPRLPYSMP